MVKAKVLNVGWRTTSKGRILPVIELMYLTQPLAEAINGRGRRVNINLNSLKQLNELKLMVNDYVRIDFDKDKPYISEILAEYRVSTASVPKMVDKCPCCGGNVIDINDTFYCLSTTSCSAQLKQNFIYYASEYGVNLAGLGDSIITRLYDADIIGSNLADIYSLVDMKDELMTIPNIREKKSNKIINGLLNRKVSLATFISALHIPTVDRVKAKYIEERFGNIDKVIKASYDDFVDVFYIGELSSAILAQFFRDKKNIKVIKHLQQLGVVD